MIISKRRRFVITSVLLSIGFVGIQFLTDQNRFWAIGALGLSTILLFRLVALGRDWSKYDTSHLSSSDNFYIGCRDFLVLASSKHLYTYSNCYFLWNRYLRFVSDNEYLYCRGHKNDCAFARGNGCWFCSHTCYIIFNF